MRVCVRLGEQRHVRQVLDPSEVPAVELALGGASARTRGSAAPRRRRRAGGGRACRPRARPRRRAGTARRPRLPRARTRAPAARPRVQPPLRREPRDEWPREREARRARVDDEARAADRDGAPTTRARRGRARATARSCARRWHTRFSTMTNVCSLHQNSHRHGRASPRARGRARDRPLHPQDVVARGDVGRKPPDRHARRVVHARGHVALRAREQHEPRRRRAHPSSTASRRSTREPGPATGLTPR